MHTFVCPDCHYAHSEPLEAAYLLAMRCFECTLALDYHDALITTATMAEAA